MLALASTLLTRSYGVTGIGTTMVPLRSFREQSRLSLAQVSRRISCLAIQPTQKHLCLTQISSEAPKQSSRRSCLIIRRDCSIREISFEHSSLRIGQFAAFDFFGDGSFYLLDTPGHAIGHMCGLARTTTTTFAFLGGDICHFSGTYID